MGRISPCEAKHAAILELHAHGLTRRQMAERLDLSERALRAYLDRRGIQSLHHKGKDYLVDPGALAELLKTGATQDEAATHFGVNRTTIERAARRKGLTGHARTGPRSGTDHPEWKGGRRLDKHGYIVVWAPLHPHARKAGGVFEHRLMTEVVLGRYLTPDEVVDHLDDHPYHNWPGNLALHDSNADHLIAELTGREKATPRRSIPGAYRCTQPLDHCPSEDETLALCPSQTRAALAYFVESHRPTTEHRSLARRQFLRSGARRDPFQWQCPE
jgi:hypothetical protein